MMSNQKNLRIMKRLANDPILEMNNDDLEQLLEAELAKPANEIDSSLVNEILDALNAPEPTPEQMEASWKVVKATLPRQAKATIPQAMLRFSAIAAAVIMIMFITLRDAEAFRWTLIEKILKPVRKAIKDKAFSRFGKKQSEVRIAELGNDAGIIGAALLWKNE